MKFLGIHDYHDFNVTYTDGSIVKHVKLERNLQIKHFKHEETPGPHADLLLMLIKCSKILNVDFSNLDAICIQLSLGNLKYPVMDRKTELNELWFQVDTNKANFWKNFNCPVFAVDHHYAHALSCWPLTDVTDKNTTHYVFDGVGEHHFGRRASIFKNDKLVDFISFNEHCDFPQYIDRLGKDWGIKGLQLDIAGKVMALQAYHDLSVEEINNIIALTEPFKYRHLLLFSKNYVREWSNTWLKDKKDYTINIMHLAHLFAEKKLPDYFSIYAKEHNIITYSGGMAQNTVINTALKNKFPNLVIPPHCPDDGISLGCVEFLRQHYDQPPFDTSNFPFWQSDEAPATVPSNDTINQTAELLAQGKIVGWYQGHGELGPRALGNRSILMDPTIKHGKDLINRRVKRREPYRPFGASVLTEHSNQLFECDYESPYMLYVIKCRDPERYNPISHVDGTCRIQTVSQQPQHEHYYRLIDRFKQLTGIPMLLNTSLNVDGKPIAGYIENANELYNTTELDALVVGNGIKIK